MGKRPGERELRRQGAEVLARIRQRQVQPSLTQEQVERLMDTFGTTQENVEELLSLEVTDG
jgi:hypothetical protein